MQKHPLCKDCWKSHLCKRVSFESPFWFHLQHYNGRTGTNVPVNVFRFISFQLFCDFQCPQKGTDLHVHVPEGIVHSNWGEKQSSHICVSVQFCFSIPEQEKSTMYSNWGESSCTKMKHNLAEAKFSDTWLSCQPKTASRWYFWNEIPLMWAKSATAARRRRHERNTDVRKSVWRQEEQKDGKTRGKKRKTEKQEERPNERNYSGKAS